MLDLHCISGSTYRLGYGRSHYDSLRVEELSLEGSVFIIAEELARKGVTGENLDRVT